MRHVVKMPIALAESACRESVENLNPPLADRSQYVTCAGSSSARTSARVPIQLNPGGVGPGGVCTKEQPGERVARYRHDCDRAAKARRKSERSAV